jgi:hypothetical protein
MMKAIKFPIFLILLLLSVQSFAIEIGPPDKGPLDRAREKFNRRAKHPLGFNFSLLGPVGLVGVSADYFIIPKIDVEAGIGISSSEEVGYFFGGKYHFFGNTFMNLTPYLGAYTAFKVVDSDLQNYNFYIPFGIHRIKRKRVCWSIEVAYQVHADKTQPNFYGCGKIGWRI